MVSRESPEALGVRADWAQRRVFSSPGADEPYQALCASWMDWMDSQGTGGGIASSWSAEALCASLRGIPVHTGDWLDAVHRALCAGELPEPCPYAVLPGWGGLGLQPPGVLGPALFARRAAALRVLGGLRGAAVVRPRGRFSSSRPLVPEASASVLALPLPDRVRVLCNFASWAGACAGLLDFYVLVPRLLAHAAVPGRGRSVLPKLGALCAGLDPSELPGGVLSAGVRSFLPGEAPGVEDLRSFVGGISP